MRMRALLPLFNAMGSQETKRRRRLIQRWLSGGAGNPPDPEPINTTADLDGALMLPSSDTQAYYVDQQDGDDTYDGRWPIHMGGLAGPVKTAHAGYALMRDGQPDWLLFKRGQTWEGADLYSGGADEWVKAGTSADAPMVIGAYGDGDPLADAPRLMGDGTTIPLPCNGETGFDHVVRTGISVFMGDPGGVDAQGTWGALPVTLGWSSLQAHATAQVFYVDSIDGNNNYDGHWPYPPGTSLTGYSDDSGIEYGSRTTVPPGGGPKRTIAAAVALASARPVNSPDWILLRRGSRWDGVGGTPDESFDNFPRSGMSATYPFVIGAYGLPSAARPIIGRKSATPGYSPAVGGGSNLALVGLDLSRTNAITGNACVKLNSWVYVSNFLVEDCLIRFGSEHNITITTADGNPWLRPNIVIRRNLIIDGIENGGGGTGSGIYSAGTDGLLIEENIIDKNGFGQTTNPWFAKAHVLYIQGGNGTTHNTWNKNVIFRGNVASRGDGAFNRSGYLKCDSNLVVNCAIGLAGTGSGDDAPPCDPLGVENYMKKNVSIDGGNLTTFGRGWAYFFNNTKAGRMQYNLVANNTTGTNPQGIVVWQSSDSTSNRGMENFLIADNIFYNWDGNASGTGWSFQAGINPPVSNVLMQRNHFQSHNALLNIGRHDDSYGPNSSRAGITPSDNKFYSATLADGSRFNENSNETDATWLGRTPADSGSSHTEITYSAPTRSPGSYHVVITGQHLADDGTTDTFLDDCRLQSRGDWSAELMPTYGSNPSLGILIAGYPAGRSFAGPLRYLRDGFDMKELGVTVLTITPDNGAAAGGTAVTITGTGFTSVNAEYVRVFVGDAATSVVVVSDTQVTAVTAAHAAGAVDVIVDSGDGYGTKVNGFTYNP